jgi:muramoyltetrapeptide carboxypeptidase
MIKIGIIAPGFRPENKDLSRALYYLPTNIDAVIGQRIIESFPSFTSPFVGTTQKFAEILSFLKDDSIDALWCFDGGAGCYKLLYALDICLSKGNLKPKPLIGFSDVSFLHMLWLKHGWPCYVGPNLYFEEDDKLSGNYIRRCASDLIEILSGRIKSGEIDSVVDVIKPGNAFGKLIAGTFSVMVQTIGTQYSPKLDNSILLMDEHGPSTPGQHEYLFWEKCQRVELTTDWKSNGLIFGEIEVSGAYEDNGEVFPSIHEVIRNVWWDIVDGPIFTGFDFGLYKINTLIPLGVDCCIVAKDGLKAKLSWSL